MTLQVDRSPETAQVRPPAARPRRLRGLTNYLYLAPAVLFVVATVVYPLLYNIVQSFFDVGLKELIQGGAPFVGLDNFADQFGRQAFWDSVLASAVYTLITVVVAYLLGLGLALLFDRPFRGHNLMRALLLLAWILPTVVSANVWRWLLDGSYGLLNALLRGVGLIDSDVFWLGRPTTAMLAVSVATAWSFAPFAMILLLAGLQSVPRTLYEAARIDGAGWWQQLTRITLPLLRPVTTTTVLLVFIYAFKTFDTVYLMTGGGPGGATLTLPLYAYREAFEFSRYDTAAVSTTVLLVVPILLSVWYFRSLRTEQRS